MTHKAVTLSHEDVMDAYARWAPVYDLAFNAVMGRGRRLAAAKASEIGGRILDIGVGTGLELPLFEPHVRVVGVDLSEPMLRVAQRRLEAQHLSHVEGLVMMDALHLAFPDHSFDVAVAPYVLTVVPHPMRMLDEMMRVVRPGGQMILVNHLAFERGLLGIAERWLSKGSASLGWHPAFPWSIIENWMQNNPQAHLLERTTVGPVGLFSLIRFRRQ